MLVTVVQGQEVYQNFNLHHRLRRLRSHHRRLHHYNHRCCHHHRRNHRLGRTITECQLAILVDQISVEEITYTTSITASASTCRSTSTTSSSYTCPGRARPGRTVSWIASSIHTGGVVGRERIGCIHRVRIAPVVIKIGVFWWDIAALLLGPFLGFLVVLLQPKVNSFAPPSIDHLPHLVDVCHRNGVVG